MALTNKYYKPVPAPSRANGSLSGTYTAATVTSSPTDSNSGAVIASGVMTLSLGFIPKYFRITNVTDGLTQEWFQGMNTGDFFETTHSTGAQTLETDDQISVNPTTGVVTVTFAGGAATDNDTVIWVAQG